MALSPHKPKHKLLLLAAGASVLVLIGVVVGFVILLSGALSTAATTQHFRITYRLLDVGLRFSVRSSTDDIEVPALDGRAMIEQGSSCFRMHCVQCHGAPTTGRSEPARGLLPTPSSLAQSAREWPPEWLYYVTRKGVRMTGMPAWEYRLSDQSLWSTVAFLKQLPFMTREQYLALERATLNRDCPQSTELPFPSSPELGKIVLRQYSCHACHRIEGVVGPQAHVGPPLIDWARRKYIAGVLPNTPENLVRWIRDPHAVSPGTLMPDLDVAEAHAREMAAYLMRLD
ncbi:MAG: c-type cytochrome [Steroidobacter sp.]